MRALLILVPLVTMGCSNSSGGGGTDGGGGAGGGGQPASAITLQDVTAQVVDANGFYVSFVVDNTKAATVPITRVDTVSVAWSNRKVTAMPGCTQAPWIVAGEKSGLVQLQVFVEPNGTDLGYDCGGPWVARDPAFLMLPSSGALVTVEVHGITADAAAFVATVTTRLMP